MKSYLLYFFAFLISLTASPFVAKAVMSDSELMICVISGDGSNTYLGIEEYVASALSYITAGDEDIEYLKALSVALRSTAMYICMEGLNHAAGTVCTRQGCCIPVADCRDYAVEAVNSTKGEYLAYEGLAMLAPFCTSVGEYTANSDTFDYLISVKNIDESSIDGFETKIVVSGAEFASVLQLPEGTSVDDGCVVYDSTGRCAFCIYGNRQITAGEMQDAFSLPSAEFRINEQDGNAVITCCGSGRGIGMSLSGSRILAKNGYEYSEILLFYFPLGTIIFN